jgi:hypothetical protein
MRSVVAFVVVGLLIAAGIIACSSSSASGAALGVACQQDSDCASSSRGEVACFIGGQGGGADGGGGAGDGGNAGKTWCSLKCSKPNQDDPLCSAPFDGFCNPRGYCKLN